MTRRRRGLRGVGAEDGEDKGRPYSDVLDGVGRFMEAGDGSSHRSQGGEDVGRSLAKPRTDRPSAHLLLAPHVTRLALDIAVHEGLGRSPAEHGVAVAERLRRGALRSRSVATLR